MAYTLKVWNGYRNIERQIEADCYEDAKWKAGVYGYPPSYIWSIVPNGA